jgi:hypothetical protein
MGSNGGTEIIQAEGVATLLLFGLLAKELGDENELDAMR